MNFSAMMAVLQLSHRRALNPDMVQGRIQELQVVQGGMDQAAYWVEVQHIRGLPLCLGFGQTGPEGSRGECEDGSSRIVQQQNGRQDVQVLKTHPVVQGCLLPCRLLRKTDRQTVSNAGGQTDVTAG